MVKPISEIRRPEIVQGAISALNKYGLSMISYDLIAEEAEMSRHLIRHYFANPEDLMVAVCDGIAAAHKEALAQGVVVADKTERLSLFLDLYFGLLSDKGLSKPDDDSAYDAMMSIATGSEAVRKCLYEQQCLLQFTIAHEVQISFPTLSQQACRELGFLFVSLLHGHWRMVATLGFSPDHAAISRAAMDRLIASYVANYDDPELGPPG